MSNGTGNGKAIHERVVQSKIGVGGIVSAIVLALGGGGTALIQGNADHDTLIKNTEKIEVLQKFSDKVDVIERDFIAVVAVLRHEGLITMVEDGFINTGGAPLCEDSGCYKWAVLRLKGNSCSHIIRHAWLSGTGKGYDIKRAKKLSKKSKQNSKNCFKCHSVDSLGILQKEVNVHGFKDCYPRLVLGKKGLTIEYSEKNKRNYIPLPEDRFATDWIAINCAVPKKDST